MRLVAGLLAAALALLDDDVVLGVRRDSRSFARNGDLSTTRGAWLTIAVQLGFVARRAALVGTHARRRLPPHRVVFAAARSGAAAANALLLPADGPGAAIPLASRPASSWRGCTRPR